VPIASRAADPARGLIRSASSRSSPGDGAPELPGAGPVLPFLDGMSGSTSWAEQVSG